MNKRRFYYSLPMILMLIVAAAGWFAADYLGNKVRLEIIEQSRRSALSVELYLSSTLKHIEGAVKSLAGSPWIAPALIFKRDQEFDRANSVLDRYNDASRAAVTYLMDADGITVASSNRNDPDSFLGKSYRFRSYFQAAAKRQPGRYFALGITTGKRGFYASHPVQDRSGKVAGVVAMKMDLDHVELLFSQYPFGFLISPEGVIFLSSTNKMVLKSLWLLDKTVREKLIASQQFGNTLTGDAFLKREIQEDEYITLEGKEFLVSRRVIDSDGWSIVLLTSTSPISTYRWIVILATISICFLLMLFTSIVYGIERSREAIRQSEESRRLLLQAIGDGVFGVDAQGELTFVNPAALRMLGFSEEEMLGRNAHALIHHSHGDGSNYALEECPMYASYARAVDSHVLDETLWRKDGSSFPVEYSSMPITKDGRVVGAVVSFKDITDRKQSEEEIRQMAYHDSLTGLPNRKLFSDRLGIALTQSQRDQEKAGIAMLDLDHFKEVNDTLGHDVGDLLLKTTAERLGAALRKGDTVARFGGDEFVLVLPGLKGTEDAIRVAQKIVESFQKPFLIDAHQLMVTTSIGIAVCPDDGTEEVVLLKNADIAMYQAKEAGRNRYRLYKDG